MNLKNEYKIVIFSQIGFIVILFFVAGDNFWVLVKKPSFFNFLFSLVLVNCVINYKIILYIIQNNKYKKLITQSIKVYSLFFVIYLILQHFEYFKDYLHTLEFLLYRGIVFILFIIVLSFVSNTLLWQDLVSEFEIFNDSKDKSSFVVFLRKYHFLLLILMYGSFGLSQICIYSNEFLANFLGVFCLIISLLYVIQFIIYTNSYIMHDKKNINSKSLKNFQVRRLSTTGSFINIETLKKGSVVCYECVKGAASLLFSAELCWKLSNGGMNAVSPWRQHLLNRQFPTDETKIWTETKAAQSLHNQAMGNPHEKIYATKNVSNRALEVFTQNDYSKPGVSGMPLPKPKG